MEVDVELLYKELKTLHREIEKNNALILSLIPEEKVSAKEMARLRQEKAKMDAGESTPYTKHLF